MKSQNLPNIIDPDLLIKKADHRILYLVLLSSMIRDGMTPEMIGNSLSIVRKYLSVLDAKYGEKQGVRLRELLAVLATLGMREPLSMRELSYLTTGSCNAEISYALIGMMRDIFPLLSTSRGYISQGTVLTGVNRFAFHDKDIASAVLQIVDDNVVPTIERMICFSISMAEKGAIILNESENACFVVFAYFDYLLGYLKGNRTKYENGNTLGLICHYISLCESYTQHVSALHRQWLAMEYCISAYDKQKKTNPSSFNIRISDNESFSGSSALAYIYKTYAGILERNLQSAKAEQYYVKAMELLRKSISRDIPASLLKLRYNVYTRCANVFAANENRDPNDAIAVSELAVEAMKALGEHPKDSDAQALASAMQNLGQKHRVAGHIDKSIECYEDALSLLSGINPLVRDEQIYATTLMNYGVALREKHQYDKAIESYKKSIEIFEKLCDEGTEQHKALLVQPYNNIAYCYREYAKASNLDTQLLLQAKLYYEKLLAVLQLLCNCGYMMDIHNQQGSAFGNYAVVLMLLKENDYAKQYFKKALDEYEAVMEQGTPLYQNGLAAACVNYQSILEPEHDCSELRRIQKIQQKLLPAGGHWQVTSSTAESEAHKRNSENSYQSTRAPSGEQPQGNHAKQIAFSTDEASINAYMSKLPQSMQGARPIGILADGSAMFKLPDSYNRIIKLEQKLRNQDYRVGGDVFVWTGYKLFEELNRKMEQSGSAKARMRSNVSILWDYINNAKADIDATQDKQAIIELKCKRITLIELLLIMSDMPEYANCDTAQSIDIVSLTECLLSDLRDIETLCINRGILATGYCLAAKVYSSRMITAEAEKYEKIAVEYEHHSRNHKDENEQISAIFAVPIQNFEPMLSQEPFSMLAHAYIALEENLTKSIASNCKTPSSCEIKAAAEIYQSISSLSSSSEYEKLAASHLWASKLVRFGDSRDIDLTIELETKVLKQVESLGLISSNEILFIEMVYDYLAIAHYHKGNPRAARDCISKAKQLSRKYTPWFAQ